MIPSEVLAFLRARGATEAEISAAQADRHLTLLVIDKHLFPHAARYDEQSIVEQAGVSPEYARSLWRSMGFPAVKEGEVAFFDEDLEALRSAVTPTEETNQFLVHQTRNISAAMSRIAEQIADYLSGMLRDLRGAGLNDAEVALVLVTNFDPDRIDRMLEYTFRRQFHAVVWRRLAEPGAADAGPDLTVGFLDLVRFAAVTEDVADEELERIVLRFEGVAHDAITEGGGRLVKMIGDAVMFVADDPVAATEVALELVDAYANDDLLPPARAGLAVGPALERGGDYFGPVVNLASRIVDVARVSRVVVSSELRESLLPTGRFTFRRLPPKRLKGMGVTTLWAVGRET